MPRYAVALTRKCFWSMRTEQQERCNGIDVTVATVIMAAVTVKEMVT